MTDIRNAIIPLTACRPHPDNYNRHDAGQIVDLRTSLRRFGQVRSVVVQAAADGYVIAAGHGIIEAAQLEGLTSLRADIIPADWPPAKVLAYLAADNELARRGDPDEGQLAELVARVKAEADDELAALAAGSAERLAEMLAVELQDAESGGERRELSTPSLIRMVVDMANVGMIERAIATTGETNRSVAIAEIFRSYLRAKGQLDGAAEDAATSQSAQGDR
jgi:ParB-like chromosome segregation protein Spo0J